MVTQRFLNQYKEYNIDNQGVEEINSLELVDFEGKDAPPNDSRLVLVLVESRLLETLDQSGSYTANDLTDRLERLKEDLWLDGFTSRFVETDVYSGSEHQDGRTVLALRQLFREILQRYSEFKGVLFVGNFPEPMLVRRWIWRRPMTETIDGVEYDQDFLRIAPERIVGRSDIVLADLNGNWDVLYEKGPKELESILAVPGDKEPEDWPKDDDIFESDAFKIDTSTFEDFFWIQDDIYNTVEQTEDTLRINIQREKRNPEVAQADQHFSNPISRPDIHVSRINARHIADNPDETFRDDNGRPLLDDKENPQSVEITNGHPHDQFTFDPGFERELIIDYLDRNHNFRSGDLAEDIDFRAGTAVHPHNDFRSAQSLLNYLNNASDDFQQGSAYGNATLIDYIDLLKESALLTGIQVHSSPWNSSFDSNYQTSNLVSATGSHPWRWKETRDDHYEPSFEDQNGLADLYVYRTLYHNDSLPDNAASFWIHIGCSVNTPNRAGTAPYTNEAYGDFQNAESILFCAKGLALMSRAKVYYDTPRGFPEAFGESLESRFGDGLNEYYKREIQDEDQGTFEKITDCKRAYTWSIIGDWTLRMRYYPLEEDCIEFDRNSISIEQNEDYWTILEGGNMAMLTAPSRSEADRILDIINRYELDKQCFVGRPDPSMEYWLIADDPPSGRMEDADVLNHNMYRYHTLEEGSNITITDGRSRMMWCSNYEEAANILRVLRKYRFDKAGYVGRPSPSMCYFLSSEASTEESSVDPLPNLEYDFELPLTPTFPND